MRRPKISRHEGAHVIGLDLSLRAAAACALPLDWDGRMCDVKTAKMGSELKAGASQQERIERIANIAHAVYVFAEENRACAICP